jgi:hypothetical protein
MPHPTRLRVRDSPHITLRQNAQQHRRIGSGQECCIVFADVQIRSHPRKARGRGSESLRLSLCIRLSFCLSPYVCLSLSPLFRNACLVSLISRCRVSFCILCSRFCMPFVRSLSLCCGKYASHGDISLLSPVGSAVLLL